MPPTPRSVARAIAVSALALFSISAPSTAHAAWPRNPEANGLPILPGQSLYSIFSMVPDGAGGAFALLYDYRSGNGDLYVQRITSQGVPAAGWPSGGLPIVTATGDQRGYTMLDGVSMVADGSGGVLVGWVDYRTSSTNGNIYATRVAANGTVVSGWPVQVSTASVNEDAPQIAPDGSGGVFLAWDYHYSPTDSDIYGAHVFGNGALNWSTYLVQPIGVQKSARIATDNAGGFFVAYLDSSSNVAVKVFHRAANGGTLSGVVTVCNASGKREDLVVASDGARGLYLAWADRRDGIQQDIYATHVDSTSNYTLDWGPHGVAVCAAANDQSGPQIVRDSGTGAFFAWGDYRSGALDVYLMRMTLGGGIAPFWPANGLAVGSGSGNQYYPLMVSDGSDGVILAWRDDRLGPGISEPNVYAQRVTGSGVVPPHWLLGGTPAGIGPYGQSVYAMCPDSSGGAILGWEDLSDVGIGSEYAKAQRIDRFGALGNAEPVITRIQDIPNDQGGQVQLKWNGSYLDADPAYPISTYWIWRSTTLAAAQAAVLSGARWMDASGEEPAAVRLPASGLVLARSQLFRPSEVEGSGYAWELVATQSASGFPQYSITVPTLVDSTGPTTGFSTFMVQARYNIGAAYWDSKPDSGRSVDNLSPSPPSPFAGTYLGGTAALQWGASPEPDVVSYELHRGPNSVFVPDAGNLVTETAALNFNDPAGDPYWYKIAAIDSHGNRSAYVATLPDGVTDVPLAAESFVLGLGAIAPNPARVASTITFTTPANTEATLILHDLQGRRVRTLASGRFTGGAHAVVWRHDDADGRGLPPGLYVVTLRSGETEFRRKLMILR